MGAAEGKGRGGEGRGGQRHDLKQRTGTTFEMQGS